jgi:hypothetical protein
MGQDPGTRKTYSEADTEVPVHPTSGAEELRRANVGNAENTTGGEPSGAQEPPD